MSQTSRCFIVCSSPHSHAVCPFSFNPHFCIRALHHPVPVRRQFRPDQVGHPSLEPGLHTCIRIRKHTYTRKYAYKHKYIHASKHTKVHMYKKDACWCKHNYIVVNPRPLRSAEIDCGHPGEIAGLKSGILGSLAAVYKFNSSFGFECETNFTISGNNSDPDKIVRCMANGKWNLGGLRCTGRLSFMYVCMYSLFAQETCPINTAMYVEGTN